MTRDNSGESTHSLLSAPAATPTNLGLGLGLDSSSLPTSSIISSASRPVPASIDVIAANQMAFGRMGEWSSNPTPITPHDTRDQHPREYCGCSTIWADGSC